MSDFFMIFYDVIIRNNYCIFYFLLFFFNQYLYFSWSWNEINETEKKITKIFCRIILKRTWRGAVWIPAND